MRIVRATTLSTDVVVIGAGPAGLATAACLVQHGLPPQVLEQSEHIAASAVRRLSGFLHQAFRSRAETDLVEHGVQAALSVRSPMNIVYRDVLGRPTQLTSIALSRPPTRLAASGELAGMFFVGFDNKQRGGLLCTIGRQARQVAGLVSRL